MVLTKNKKMKTKKAKPVASMKRDAQSWLTVKCYQPHKPLGPIARYFNLVRLHLKMQENVLPNSP